jgi:hypothetical protein
MGRRVLIVLVVLGLGAAGSPPALGANRTLAKFTWSFRGHLRHDWSQTSSDPCAWSSVTGYVESSFTGRGHGPFKVTSTPYGVIYDYDPRTTLTGTVTETYTPGAQNPSDDPLNPCPKNNQTPDCGTHALKQGFGWLESTASDARKLLFSATDIGNAFNTCGHSLFNDWGRVANRELGRMRIPLPPPTTLARVHGSIGRSAHKANTIGRDHQVRDVTVTLHRVG